jgi:Transglutaminase-like superfamily
MENLLTDYARPGPLTGLDPTQVELGAWLAHDAVAVCLAVQSLVIEPDAATAAGVPERRLAERNIRSARALIEVLTTLAPLPLHEPRAAQLRVVGTCRHFAVLSCALLRMRGIPARARCGFATYFVDGKSVDHWVVEHWRSSETRWVRVDAEVIGTDAVPDATDLAPDDFLTGGEGWVRYRGGSIDPALFGVVGVDHAWGIGEIRGNAIRDLASLRKVEMLPWDEWGRMDDSYQGKTGADYDELMDTVAAACASNDLATIRRTYALEDLTVPDVMIR